ncbi:hypothetical protein D3273_19200 [Lichenibacterium minor]|uniref:Uncharacterized protein n=1 Tax=Lichenibacterium minor TaxID=2316528 RepID=A0A4Q2U5Q7_9HYPH|nr:hypothetical protein [Lichenibacterium minor]RYC30401.1 hypothetical protein D3273_19200 [Lichenibacterium minor]
MVMNLKHLSARIGLTALPRTALSTGLHDATGAEHRRLICNHQKNNLMRADFPSGISRNDLDRLSKQEPIEPVSKLQRSAKSGRASSRPHRWRPARTRWPQQRHRW